ncbi:hypothetical protein B7R21_12545 [Subtercola boreus]|uniref:Bacterial Ig-like domain-containing protein n=1 Tax=Subtercola boreus TaxID=120213 RepID=A0A3E0VNR9_9MICO|nr:hypothetical protein B7R21_12545 [Subtercola boreus]
MGLLLPAALTLATGSERATAAVTASATTTTEPTPAPSVAPGVPAPTSTPAPTPPPTPPPSDPDPISRPEITSPGSGELLGGGFTITGTAEPGSSVQISASTRSDPLCVSTVGTDGTFSCSTGALPNAPGVQLRVVQLVSGHANSSDTVTVDVLNAPTAESGSSSGVSTGYGTVRGSAAGGATVRASAAGDAGSFDCLAVADGSGGWACNLGAGIPSGILRVQATQSTTWSGGESPASASFTLRIDSDTPAPPVVTSPARGTTVRASGAVFAGTGEPQALVTVFAGSFAACTATVQNGAWSCTAGDLAATRAPVSAIQQDAAGNVSNESTAFDVVFVAGTPTPGPSASAPAAPGAASGGTEAPGAGGAAGAGGTGGAASGDGSGAGAGAGGADGTGGAGGATGQGDGGASGGSGAGSGGAPGSPGPGGSTPHTEAHGADGSWAGSTRFSVSLAPVFGQASGLNWLLALGVAVAALLLVAAPARLMAGALSVSFRARIRRTGTLLTGRNRPRNEFDRAPELALNPWVLASVSIVAAAAIGMLSGPVENQPAYLRLLAAICIAFAVLNAVSVLVPRLLGLRMLGIRSTVTFAPRYLALAVVATIVSRVFTIEPALLFGLVLAAGCADGASRRIRGQFAMLHLLTLLVLGGVAWTTISLLPALGTPFGAFATEILNTLALGSFGAAAVLVLPFGRFSGRALFAWSRAAWLATALGAFTLLAAVVAPAVTPGAGIAAASAPVPALAALLLVGVGFAAVSLSVWAWLRFVAPALK